MYTSGTTGRPKGAEITYQMCVFNAVQCAMTIGLTANTKNLVFLPTFHTGGLNVYANPTFHTGGCNVVMRSFDPGQFLRLLSDRALGLTHPAGRADQLPDAGAGAGLRRRRLLAHRLHRRRRRGGTPGADRGIRPQGHQAAAGLGHDRDRAARAAAVGRDGARQGGLLRPAAALCAAEDLRSRRQRGEAGRDRRADDPGADRDAGLLEPAGGQPTSFTTTAGSTPATPRARTRTATTISSIAGRTCSSPAARTSIRSRSRT